MKPEQDFVVRKRHWYITYVHSKRHWYITYVHSYVGGDVVVFLCLHMYSQVEFLVPSLSYLFNL